jgi:hypothetical protein
MEQDYNNNVLHNFQREVISSSIKSSPNIKNIVQEELKLLSKQIESIT